MQRKHFHHPKRLRDEPEFFLSRLLSGIRPCGHENTCERGGMRTMRFGESEINSSGKTVVGGNSDGKKWLVKGLRMMEIPEYNLHLAFRPSVS